MTETETNYPTTFKSLHHLPKKELHSTFGGIITGSDFNTEYNTRESVSSLIANRIITARKFDYQCKRNAESRKRGKNNDQI